MDRIILGQLKTIDGRSSKCGIGYSCVGDDSEGYANLDVLHRFLKTYKFMTVQVMFKLFFPVAFAIKCYRFR